MLQQGASCDTATQPASVPFEPPPATDLAPLFPQLEIISLIGRGGMGAVYKARQPALDRFVALKLLPAQPEGAPGFSERFNREARALARLSHPHIVAVHDFGQVNKPGEAGGGFHYVLMEFVDGVNLRQLQRNRRLSPREALQIVPQICDALQYAHDEGVVHRDIKPENILLDRKGRVRIADFGLAKLLDAPAADPRLTQEGQVMGTPHYMAPEQIEHPHDVDHRADIFSLGVVFYELLTGELPLGKFPPPSSKSRGIRVDVRLDDVVLRALEKEPERRYQQAGEVKTAVETIAGATADPALSPAPASDPGGPSQTGKSYAYETRARILGWPLVSVVWGGDPATGRERVAKGVVAVGPKAIGVVAVGLTAFGLLPAGLVAIGAAPVGLVSLGLAGTGLFAVALLSATGMIALAPFPSGLLAIGPGSLAHGSVWTVLAAVGVTALALGLGWRAVAGLRRGAASGPAGPGGAGVAAEAALAPGQSRAQALALVAGVAVSCVVFLSAAVMTTLQPPIYRSTARILVQRPAEGGTRSSGSLAPRPSQGALSYDPYFLQTEFTRLQSSTVLTTVVERLNLGERWGKRYGAGQPLGTPECLELLRGQLRVEQRRGNDLLEVSVNSPDREEAAEVANTLVECYRAQRPELKVVVVDPAEPAWRAVRPNVQLNLAAGAGGGLLLGLLCGWLTLRLMRPRPSGVPPAAPAGAPLPQARTNPLALGLFLAGTLGTLVLMTLSPRHDLALIFGATALVLAVVIAWRGRPERVEVRRLGGSPWLVLLGVVMMAAVGATVLQARQRAALAAALRAEAMLREEQVRLAATVAALGRSTPRTAQVPETRLDPEEAARAIADYGGFLTYNEQGRVTRVSLVYDEDAQGRRRECEAKGDEVTKWLPAFPDVTELLLHGNQATDRAMESVAKLSRLKALHMWWAQVSDSGVAKLAGLRELETLHISASNIGDASLASLARLPKLRSLALQENRFSDAGLAHLARMPQLTHVWVGMGSGQITDAGLASLAALTNLVVLDLQNYAITDRGLESLKGLSRLQQLYLGESPVSPEGQAMLQAAIPGLRIQ